MLTASEKSRALSSLSGDEAEAVLFAVLSSDCLRSWTSWAKCCRRLSRSQPCLVTLKCDCKLNLTMLSSRTATHRLRPQNAIARPQDSPFRGYPPERCLNATCQIAVSTTSTSIWGQVRCIATELVLFLASQMQTNWEWILLCLADSSSKRLGAAYSSGLVMSEYECS